jgi:hypothetical protein
MNYTIYTNVPGHKDYHKIPWCQADTHHELSQKAQEARRLGATWGEVHGPLGIVPLFAYLN